MLWSRLAEGSSDVAETARALARTTVFLLKVFPMLPSGFLNRLTPTPLVETLPYPSSRGLVAGELYRPPGAGPYPGVVVCLGVVPFEVDHPQVPRLGEALARAGYATLLYWSPAMRDKRLDAADIGDIALACDCLMSQPFVDSSRCGLFGTCVGGSFALMAAAHPLVRERVHFAGAFAPYSSMATMTVGIASSTRATPAGRVRWEVDPLTREVYAHTLACLLPARHGDQGELEDSAVEVDRDILTGSDSAPDAVQAALDRLPDATLEALDRLSPLSYAADICAPTVLIGHDRDDAVIPVGESQQLLPALAGRTGLHYTEFALFQHADPTKRRLALPQLIWQLGKFYRYVLPQFRI